MNENKRKKAIRKIKKLLAITNDKSANKTEVLQALALAQRTMMKYKIEESEITNDGSNDINTVCEWRYEKKCPHDYYISFRVVADYFRCHSCYYGRSNSNNCIHAIFGLEEDIELCKPFFSAIHEFLDRKLKDLKDVCIDDYKIAKRDYCYGFASGLKEAFQKTMIDMKLDKGTELMIMEKPQVVKDYVKSIIEVKKRNIVLGQTSYYERGRKDGKKYNVKSENN